MAQGTPVDLDEVRSVAAQLDAEGKSPSMSDVAASMGISIATVRRALAGDDRTRQPAQEKQNVEAMKVLAVIRLKLLENGWAPSQREIASTSNFTVVRVNYLLQVLKHQGLIEIGPNPREIRIVGSSMVIPEVAM